MNITDYILECLQKGKTVEIPGVGTWKSVVETAHFDEQSATFFPTRSVVVFDAATTGNEEFVSYLSDTECVSTDVAKQMLNNYAQALNEKLDKENIVAVGSLGVLRSQNGAKSFVSQPIASGADETAPLANVKTYNSVPDDDPFAMFDPVKRAEATAREQQAAAARAELERMSGVANIVGGADILQGNATVELTPQEVKELERRIKEETKRLKQDEKDREREAREAAIREQDDARRSDGEISPEDIERQKRAEQEAAQLEKLRLEHEQQEARKTEERREEEERRAREKAEKEEAEAKIRAEREEQKAREKQAKEELEAKKAEEKRIKEELKAKEKAEREEQEAKAKAEKEARKEQEQREKEEREARYKAEHEARKEKELQEKAEREARKEQERLEQEEREAKAKAEKAALMATQQKEKAEKEAQKKAEKAERKAAKLRKKEERKAAKKARKEGKKHNLTTDPLAVPAVSFDSGLADENNGKKKKSRTWLWILLALLLLLVLACVAIYVGKPGFVKPAHEWLFSNVLKQNVSKDADYVVSNSDAAVSSDNAATGTNESGDPATLPSSLANQSYADACMFSFSEQLTDFTTSDIESRADAINDYLSGYISNYLAARHYSTAKVPMMERIHQYSVSRLSELLSADGFTEERFFASSDYVSDYLAGFKKAHKGRQKQVTVQGEIMDQAFLDNMLTIMVDELGLKADNAKVVLPPAPKVEKPVIKTEKKSRQGFDLIAGFFTDINTAQRMVDRLKGYGCNAYIIEINHGYYVSMGSAKTRTLAEEKFRKAKEWYDRDLSIKEF